MLLLVLFLMPKCCAISGSTSTTIAAVVWSGLSLARLGRTWRHRGEQWRGVKWCRYLISPILVHLRAPKPTTRGRAVRVRGWRSGLAWSHSSIAVCSWHQWRDTRTTCLPECTAMEISCYLCQALVFLLRRGCKRRTTGQCPKTAGFAPTAAVCRLPMLPLLLLYDIDICV